MKINRFVRFGALALAALGSVSAHAAAGDIDVSAAVTQIGGTLAPIGQIGLAVFGVMVSIKLWQWLRKAL